MESLDDLPIFRPRIGGRRGRIPRGEGARLRNVVLSSVRRGGRRALGRGGATAGLGDRFRRVIVKAHVARLHRGAAKAAALHLRYIERDGVEKDGAKGVLYGPDGPIPAAVFEQPRIGEKHQFRIIVAPEDGAELNLTAYVRRLMTQVERDLGRPLEWGAVNHHDTDHPHAHLIVRGVDREGREVRLDRDYISHGLRSRAQELATQELGPRRDVDLRRSRTQEVTQERFTSLDRELARRAPEDRIEVRSLQRARGEASALVARLEYLEGLRLAERAGPASWEFHPGWQERLRELGMRGDILKQMHRAVAGDSSRYRVVRAGEALDGDRAAEAPVHLGRIAAKGLVDELKGAFFAVLETPSGHAYHVPLHARVAEQFRVGDLVSFASPREPAVRPVDREISDGARAAGGVYVLQPTADRVSQAHVRRLRDLERLGLAVAEAPQRWRVPPDLLEQLEQRHRTSLPRYRLVVRKEPLLLEQQVRHPGEVWLDRLESGSVAPYGFGAAVKRAQEQRRAALRALGVTPDGPNRAEKLQELERRAVGRGMAARSGQVFLAEAPHGFRGHVGLGDPGASGASYVVVSDRARFVVLPATDMLRAWQGKVVTIARDARGQLLVRSAPEKDRGR